MNDNSKIVTRRKALQVLGAGVLAPAVLSACAQETGKAPAKKEAPKKEAPMKEAAPASKPAEAAAAKPEAEAPAAGGELACNDASKIDAQSATMRKTLQYVEKSVQEGKVCSKCMQWNEPETAGGCGGCKLFTGPVHPNGYCLSYAPKAA